MASPQLEDGYTKIANEVLEAMARINLSAYQSSILMVVWRKTYGWNKKEDYISVSQIARMTGIHKRNVSQNIKKLIEKNIIRKNGRRMAFNKNHSQWRGLRRKGIDLDTPKQKGIDSDTGGIDLDTPRVFKSMDTKETVKDTNKRKQQSPPFKAKEIDYSQLSEKTDRLAKSLSTFFKKFNLCAWRQQQINKRQHPEAIQECLNLLWEQKNTVKNPRAYITQLMKIKGPNAFERDAIARHEKRKQEELALVDYPCSQEDKVEANA